jgi:hypothetical protein
MPGNRMRSIAANRRRVYEALKTKVGKTRAAKIANAGKTQAGRSTEAKKAARTRTRKR